MYLTCASFILSSHPATGNYSWLSVGKLIISPCGSSLTEAAGSEGRWSLDLIFLSFLLEGKVSSSIIPVPVSAVSVNLAGIPMKPDGIMCSCSGVGIQRITLTFLQDTHENPPPHYCYLVPCVCLTNSKGIKI